jgi:hypothetical protein
MTVAIHQPQYLPWLPYIDKADQADVFVYLDTVQYQKNGLQNRNQILTAQGPRWLTVPVHASLDRAILETTIADPGWARKHVRTIEQEYRKAPAFGLFRDELAPLLAPEYASLAELNIAVTEWIFAKLQVASRRVRASELGVTGGKEELVLRICATLGASAYLSGEGARSYQKPEHFGAQGIELRYQQYRNPSYAQCHGSDFTPDLSALDLLLNAGAAGREIMLSGRLPCSS